jgi:hypothetical protein
MPFNGNILLEPPIGCQLVGMYCHLYCTWSGAALLMLVDLNPETLNPKTLNPTTAKKGF